MSSLYSVYLGSYKTLGRAKKAISEYGKKGLSPYWLEVDLGKKGVWYRIFTGQFQNRGQAEEFIKEKRLVDAEVRETKHAAQISAHSTKNDITEKEGSDKQKILPKATGFSYPYSLYLGSYKTLDRARKAVSIFKEKGISSYWAKVDLESKGVWFRVYAGYFQSRDEAEAFAKNNQIAEGKSRHTRYANLIGTYTSEEELSKMSLVLIELGYYPYVIKGTEGESLLFTGAFYQEARAEKERSDLASKGIQTQLVER